MTSPTTTDEVLPEIARAMPGTSLCIVGADGTAREQFGVEGVLELVTAAAGPQLRPVAGRAAVSVRLHDGSQVIATYSELAQDAAVAHAMLQTALQLYAKSVQLEQDMESMNHGSMQLLEQVAMLGETLPKLSAAESEAEIATTGLLACVVATGAERGVYVRIDQRSNRAEVLVHVQLDAAGRAVVRDYPLPEAVASSRGLLAEVLLGHESVVLRSTGGLGDVEPGAPESLARREVLGASITCDDGDRRVGLGALLLYDKAHSTYGTGEARLGSEERQVALSFASMLGAVIGARQSAELGKELSMAQAIQAQILPERAAVVPGFDLAGDYRTSGDVGGDYFDFVPLADGRTLCVVADVSGHNLASGMMMVSARATLRTLANVHGDPARLFEMVANGMYHDLMRTERFITAAGVALRPDDAGIEIVNAGHNDLLLYRKSDRRVARLRADSTVFGFLPRTSYERLRLELEPGDCLLLYTDGVTEAANEQQEMYGEERLMAVLAANAGSGAAQIVAAVLASVQQFRSEGDRGDDVTVVAVKRT